MLRGANTSAASIPSMANSRSGDFRSTLKGGNMVSINVRGIRAGGLGEVTVVVTVRSQDLAPFTIDVALKDQGNARANRESARVALKRFANEFAEALQQPLHFESSWTV
jgi:hypothetical protein